MLFMLKTGNWARCKPQIFASIIQGIKVFTGDNREVNRLYPSSIRGLPPV